MAPPATTAARPLVSVVMIFFQEERFIAEAIESVRAQTHPEWELLLVDDGSTDGSTALARGYAERMPDRIRYLQHPGGANRGMAASRKLGMAAARGPLVAFLDADDAYLPTRLAHHVELIERLPAPSIVIGSDLYWHSWQRDAREPDRVLAIGVRAGERYDPPRLLELMLRPGLAAAPGICSVTFHRLEADGTSGAPDEFVGHYEDQCLYDALLARRPALVTDQALARYRQHPGSFTARTATGDAPEGHGNLAERHFLEWLRDHLAAQALLTGTVAAALAARLAPHQDATRSAETSARRAARAIGRLAGAAVHALPPAGERLLRRAFGALREAARRRRIRRAERDGC